MDTKIRIIVLVLSLLWLLAVLRLVKRRSIWERHAILWVSVGSLLVILPLCVRFLDAILFKLGVSHPPSFFFFVGFLAVFSLLMQCTVEITRLVRQNRDAIQNLAILEDRVRQLEDDLTARRKTVPAP